MASLSTHVLDTSTGRPAAGVAVELRGPGGESLAKAVTDSDGRVGRLGGDLPPEEYRLTFATGQYFAARGEESFYPRVTIEFRITDGAGEHAAGEDASAHDHYHVPLLVSRYGYTTYRGS